MTSKPAIIICTGAFHTPEHYENLGQHLKSAGFDVVIPALPTMSVSNVTPHDTSGINPTPPASGWSDGFTDADCVKQEIRNLVEAGSNVVLVGHSYGGWVITESAVPELRLEARKAQGLQGGLVGLFYMSGYILPAGQSVDSFFSPQGDATPLPPFVNLHGEGKKGLVVPFEPEQYFFGDLPEAEAKHWASKLRAQPVIKSPLSHASYVELPTAYLLCKEDKVFPLMVQEMMVKLALDQGAKVTQFHCSASHSPFLSWTAGTANAITEFATGL